MMTEHDFFLSKGAVDETPITAVAQGASATAQGAVYNFGVKQVDSVKQRRMQTTPTLYGRFPRLQGKWDGKSTVNHHLAVQNVFGKFLPAHNQPRGTCGGRAGSRGLEILQCVLINAGVRAKFRFVSHALIYWLARREYKMDKGNPSDERNDGVAGGSVPEILAKYGCVHREESGDLLFAGQGSDDLACKWGAGKIDEATKTEMLKLASDNIVTAKVRAQSAQECADGLAAGGVIIQSDAQGYEMTRDRYGVCRAKGTWYHYQVRSGVRVTPDGRKVFQYDQSWGDDTPQGPLLEGCPGNVFGVEWDVQDRLCKNGEVDIILGFDLFDLEQGAYDLDYIY